MDTIHFGNFGGVSFLMRLSVLREVRGRKRRKLNCTEWLEISRRLGGL